MKFLFSILFILSSISIFSQKKIGIDTTILAGKEQNIFSQRYIYTNAQNDKYIIGSFKGSCTIENTTIITNSNIPTDMCRGIYIVKYNNTNNFIWLKKICESDSIVKFYSTIDKSGNILLTLVYRTTLYKYNDTLINVNHLGDLIILKIDSSGNEIFNNIIATPCFETIYSIITDDYNNIFFAGHLDNNLNNCPTYFDSLLVLNDTIVYLAKMDSNGTYIWVKKYSVGIIDRLYFYNDNLYCLGRCNGFNNNYMSGINITYPLTYYSKCFMAKLDTSGNCIWARRFGSKYNNALGYVSPGDIKTRNDKIYFTGSGNDQNQLEFLFDGGPNLLGTMLTNSEAFVACYDTSGNFKWRTLVPDVNYLSQLTTDSNSNVIGVGSSEFTMYVKSYDSAGNFNWNANSHANTLCNTVGSGIAPDTDGKLFIVGGTNCSSGLFMGNDTLYPPANQSTMFFSSLDSIDIITPLSSGEVLGYSDNLKIYPNPTSTYIDVRCEMRDKGNVTIEMYNVLGQLMYASHSSYLTSHISINTSSYPNGLYFLTYKNNKQSITKKINIQH